MQSKLGRTGIYRRGRVKDKDQSRILINAGRRKFA